MNFNGSGIATERDINNLAEAIGSKPVFRPKFYGFILGSFAFGLFKSVNKKLPRISMFRPFIDLYKFYGFSWGFKFKGFLRQIRWSNIEIANALLALNQAGLVESHVLIKFDSTKELDKRYMDTVNQYLLGSLVPNPVLEYQERVVFDKSLPIKDLKMLGIEPRFGIGLSTEKSRFNLSLKQQVGNNLELQKKLIDRFGYSIVKSALYRYNVGPLIEILKQEQLETEEHLSSLPNLDKAPHS